MEQGHTCAHPLPHLGACGGLLWATMQLNREMLLLEELTKIFQL